MNSRSDTQSLLAELVSIESVYPNEQKVAQFIEHFLKSRGFTVERVMSNQSRPNLVATLGDSDRYLGFYGHMDTVPAASDYQRNPFALDLDGDIVRGLGVCDMKGGLTCILQAASWAAEKKIPIKVIFGVDEENISQGAHDLVDSGLMKEISFLIVAESGQITDYNQPLSICLGRKGRIVYQIEVHGRSTHAAESEKGINAIEKASELIQTMRQFPLPSHSRLGNSTLVIQAIHSECDAFSVPDKCTLTVSLLTTPGMCGADFEDLINDSTQRLGITAHTSKQKRNTPFAEAFEIDCGHPFYKILEREIFRPLEATPIYTPSVADENIFANRLMIPVLSIGVIGGGDHTKDEWANIRSFSTVIESYKKALVLWRDQLMLL